VRTETEFFHNLSVFGYDPTPEFIAFDPQYRTRRAKCYDAMAALQLELVRQTAQPHSAT
jgi:hypothetical protein